MTDIFHYKYVVSGRSFEIILNWSAGRLKGLFPPFPVPWPKHCCFLPCSRTVPCAALWLFRSGTHCMPQKSAGSAVLLATKHTGNGEAGCARLQPTSRESRGLNQRKLTVNPDALYVWKHRANCATAAITWSSWQNVFLFSISYFGVSSPGTWSCAWNLFPLRLQLTCVYQK